MNQNLLEQVTLPGNITVKAPDSFNPQFADIGSVLTSAFEIVLYAAGFLMIFWLFWGIYQYIFAGGSKEALGKARARITWALVGFVITVLAFALTSYIQGLVPQNTTILEN